MQDFTKTTIEEPSSATVGRAHLRTARASAPALRAADIGPELTSLGGGACSMLPSREDPKQALASLGGAADCMPPLLPPLPGRAAGAGNFPAGALDARDDDEDQPKDGLPELAPWPEPAAVHMAFRLLTSACARDRAIMPSGLI